MKTITWNDKKIILPEGWHEVTIKQQMIAEKINSTQKHIKSLGIMSAYTGIDVKDLKEAKTNSLIEIMSNLNFISKPINNEAIFKFTFIGEEYNVAETMLKQQFQDFVACQTAMAEYRGEYWKQAVYLLAIMAKKKDETLDSYDVNERATFFIENGMDVETINRVASFFLSRQRVSNFISVLSLPVVQKAIVQGKLAELEVTLSKLKRLRGGNLLIRLWIFVMRLWIKFYIRHWVKSCNSQVSNNSKKNWKQIWKRLQLRMHKRKIKINDK
jgi:hypothetical protein